MRIIIVEDETRIREGMARLIETQTEHVIVAEAADGEEGLELILRFKPDLVIMDIQMPKKSGLEVLKELYESKIPVNIVILSGYSEFEYARTALKYGVDDYLLKPLGAEDIQNMLNRIEEKIKKNELLYGTPEVHFRNLIVGNEIMQSQAIEMLKQICGITEAFQLELFVVYVGAASATYRIELEQVIKDLKRKHVELQIFLAYIENDQRVYILVANKEEKQELIVLFERTLFNRMLSNYCGKEESPVWGKSYYEQLKQTKSIAEKINQWISYALVLKSKTWITEDIVCGWSMNAFKPPTEIYNRIRAAICQGNQEMLRNATEDFLYYMETGGFGVEETRRAFIKSYYLITDTLQDIDKNQLTYLKNANIIRNIELAVTWKEIETSYRDIVRALTGNKVKREDISNYVIKKAINYIREHYQEGITQEEISRELNITPEYLSTLFNREVGVKFSVFLKQFRLSHAKRLLQGTDKKIYEIAVEIGYSDAKYFQRVFKEEIGISPGEYRQING